MHYFGYNVNVRDCLYDQTDFVFLLLSSFTFFQGVDLVFLTLSQNVRSSNTKSSTLWQHFAILSQAEFFLSMLPNFSLGFKLERSQVKHMFYLLLSSNGHPRKKMCLYTVIGISASH